MSSNPFSSIRNAWIFITQRGTTFMIREDQEGCWLSEQSGSRKIPFPSPREAARALADKRSGIREWDALPFDVPAQLAEWTQILPTNVFNRQVRNVVERYRSA